MLNLKELLNPATPPRKPSPSPPPPQISQARSYPHSYAPQQDVYNTYTPPKHRESISLDQLVDKIPTPRTRTPVNSHLNREGSVRSDGKTGGKKSRPAPRPAGKTLPALQHLSTQSRRPTESPSGSERSSQSPSPHHRDREETVTDEELPPPPPAYVPEPIVPAPPTKKRKQPAKKKERTEGGEAEKKKKKPAGDGAPKKKGIAKVQAKKKAKVSNLEPILPPPILPQSNGITNGSHNGVYGEDKDTQMTGVDAYNTLETRSDENIPSSEMDYENSGEVFCICRGPDNGRWMIGCDGCEDWFHGECVNIKESDGDQVDKYFCLSCHDKGKGTTSWKRTCRLPGCRRPAKTDANPPSKYCSPEHGKQYFTLLKVRAQTQAEKAVPPRQLAAILQKLAVSNNSNTAQDFKALGERIPTPPLVPRLKENPSLDKDGRFEPELLALEKASKRLKLAQARKQLTDKRTQFLTLAITRGKECKQENGKPACGFDKRLSLGDEEFEKLAEAGYPAVDAEELCTAGPNCARHKGWQKKFADEVAHEERLVSEEVASIKAEEKRVNEVLKLKVIGLEEGALEGWTEVEG